MRQEGEPSVEEILGSIKRVIARDNRIASMASRGASVGQGGAQGRETRQVVEDDNVLDLAMSAQFLDATEDEAGAEGGNGHEAPLIGDDVRASMRESLAALAMMAQPGAAPHIVRQGETSLEGLTRELLRPMLAEWLDRNLPPVVERLVADEIARIVGKKG